MHPSQTARLFTLVFCMFASQLTFARAPEMAPESERATRVHVDKSDRALTLFRNDTPIASYRVKLGANPRGHKQAEGDERTPEGRYVLDYKNPNSRFHLSIHVSYPNESDRAAARAVGRDPGGEIMIHGGNRWWRFGNWTDGCIAVTDEEMEEIWRLVSPGTPIQIDP
jgi:murein L,D-transpeptidase YafK